MIYAIANSRAALGGSRNSIMPGVESGKSRCRRVASTLVRGGKNCVGTAAPGCPAEQGSAVPAPATTVELCSTRQPRAAVSTSFYMTGFLRVPTPSTITSMISPASTGPTPLGVPVEIRSPGASVITWEM
jgi:hypothetical protein